MIAEATCSLRVRSLQNLVFSRPGPVASNSRGADAARGEPAHHLLHPLWHGLVGHEQVAAVRFVPLGHIAVQAVRDPVLVVGLRRTRRKCGVVVTKGEEHRDVAGRLDELVVLLRECREASELTGRGQDEIRRVTRDTHDPLHCPWRVDVELGALLLIRKERDVVVSSDQSRHDDVGDLLLDDGARALVGVVRLDHRGDIVILARVPLDNCSTSTVTSDDNRGVGQITWNLWCRAIFPLGDGVVSALHLANQLVEHVPLVRDEEEVTTFRPIVEALREPEAIVGDDDEACPGKLARDRPTRREVPVRRRGGNAVHQDDGWRRVRRVPVGVAEPVQGAGQRIARVMHGKAYGLDAQFIVHCGCCTGRGRKEHKKYHGNKSGASKAPADTHEARVDV